MDKLCNIQTMEYYYSMLKKKKGKKNAGDLSSIPG